MRGIISTDLRGIDISHWDDSINLAQAKSEGITVVYIKASEGESFTDPKFTSFYTTAHSLGLHVYPCGN